MTRILCKTHLFDVKAEKYQAYGLRFVMTLVQEGMSFITKKADQPELARPVCPSCFYEQERSYYLFMLLRAASNVLAVLFSGSMLSMSFTYLRQVSKSSFCAA